MRATLPCLLLADITQKLEMFFTITATCLLFMAFIKTAMRLLNNSLCNWGSNWEIQRSHPFLLGLVSDLLVIFDSLTFFVCVRMSTANCLWTAGKQWSLKIIAEQVCCSDEIAVASSSVFLVQIVFDFRMAKNLGLVDSAQCLTFSVPHIVHDLKLKFVRQWAILQLCA